MTKQMTFLDKLEIALKKKGYLTKRTAHYLSVAKMGMMPLSECIKVDEISKRYGATSFMVPRAFIGKRSKYSGGVGIWQKRK